MGKRFGITKQKYTPVVKTPEQLAADKLTRERKDFMKAILYGRSIDDAAKIVNKIVTAANIRGMRHMSEFNGGSGYIEFERGNRIGCSMSIRFDHDYDSRVVNPDNPQQAVAFFTPNVEVTWSSTGRDVAAATASLNLYREVIELAAEIETVLKEESIKRYWSLGSPDQPACTCGLAYRHPVSEYAVCTSCKEKRDESINAGEIATGVE